METIQFNRLLLKTAFSCMACDGDIDKREIRLIRQLHHDSNIFGDMDMDKELESLLLEINKDGLRFLKDYFSELIDHKLSQSDELKLIEVAIATIKADEKVEYSEIKFFKVIRSKLNIDNKLILEKHPDFEDYLEEDIITESYLLRLQDDFFDAHDMPKFEKIDLHLE
ncbi:TerB family tellurite resistance protein [Flagellimonas lutimaris]|uniref:TerB family tellurite resistance protein n=1 Tax=Flagellimonas lutimaris TaxID=475082 RepID=A0A3A1N6X0_9FLAO|nr:TerB family tellurite resistance protein [Allomuricauda lutimaris]RIV31534.1 TerB family tellurite resistance protein [Allomuricauda lutimaris]